MHDPKQSWKEQRHREHSCLHREEEDEEGFQGVRYQLSNESVTRHLFTCLFTSHNNEFRNTSVQGLCGFVSTLLQLLVVRGLLNEIKDGAGQ